MNIITKIVFFIFIVFTLNIILYYTSEDYMFFIKKIKNADKVIYTDKININDKVNINSNGEVKDTNNKITINDLNYTKNTNRTENKIIKKDGKVDFIKKEVILGKNFKDIINLFSKYKLNKLETHANLFDLTDEYPSYYYEYYSKDLTLYLFTGKTYEEVKDIIKVISYDIPYSINEKNNFLDKSFYINLDNEIKDNKVRIVIKKKNVIFGLKIEKKSYNDIKRIIKEVK